MWIRAKPPSAMTNTTLAAGEHDRWTSASLDGEPASIGDTVWFDADADGIQDSGETGVPGVMVTLYSAAGTPLASTYTDADGHYAFTDLAPGDCWSSLTRPPAIWAHNQTRATMMRMTVMPIPSRAAPW